MHWIAGVVEDTCAIMCDMISEVWGAHHPASKMLSQCTASSVPKLRDTREEITVNSFAGLYHAAVASTHSHMTLTYYDSGTSLSGHGIRQFVFCIHTYQHAQFKYA